MGTKQVESPKRGRGRPRIKPGEDTFVVRLRVTGGQRDKLGRLGGALWVRARIDRAKEPEPE